jgi:hypothetical protein
MKLAKTGGRETEAASAKSIIQRVLASNSMTANCSPVHLKMSEKSCATLGAASVSAWSTVQTSGMRLIQASLPAGYG